MNNASTCWGDVDSLMAAYHDEWGVPSHDDQHLFEMLVLETFQAGLSWATILRKRDHFRRGFDNWDARRIAAYGPADVERLMADGGIVRNRRKIEAAVKNAGAFLGVQAEYGKFDRYIWSFTGGGPLVRPPFTAWSEMPTRTPESDAMAKDLKRRGFAFVGSTSCYAFMQSVGIVNDHLAGCPLAAG